MATTNFDGAGHWAADHSRYFAGKDVAILQDFDELGMRHAQAVANSVNDFAASVRVVSIAALLKLLKIHDKQPKRAAKINSLLQPHDFTRLDHLVGDYCELFEEAGHTTAPAAAPAPAGEPAKRGR